jgi:Flp pilus assembly pilin Flp
MTSYTHNKIKGATMIEYVLIAGLISIAAAALLTPLGTKVGSVFTSVTSALPS